MFHIARTEGRTVFGDSPADYHRFRPPYPNWVYETLTSRCGLGPTIATFEIGPGSGIATRELVRLGADPIVAIESDPRFAAHLRETLPSVEVICAPFEEADLAIGAFDLGVAATSMHWLEEAGALRRVAELLKPGGYWACWWNSFGDPSRKDPFHEATDSILGGLGRSPSSGERGKPYALDSEARVGALKASGAFQDIYFEANPWTLDLDTEGVRGLYATYSEIARLPEEEKQDVLASLAEVAEREFNGVIQRNMVTVIYTAQRVTASP